MRPDPNYPRMLFHRSKDPVIVHSEEQEAAMGAEWSRTIPAPQPAEPKPAAASQIAEKAIPSPVVERVPEPEEEEPEPVEEPPAEPAPEEAPAPKPKRGRPAHHKAHEARKKHGNR